MNVWNDAAGRWKIRKLRTTTSKRKNAGGNWRPPEITSRRSMPAGRSWRQRRHEACRAHRLWPLSRCFSRADGSTAMVAGIAPGTLTDSARPTWCCGAVLESRTRTLCETSAADLSPTSIRTLPAASGLERRLKRALLAGQHGLYLMNKERTVVRIAKGGYTDARFLPESRERPTAVVAATDDGCIVRLEPPRED